MLFIQPCLFLYCPLPVEWIRDCVTLIESGLSTKQKSQQLPCVPIHLNPPHILYPSFDSGLHCFVPQGHQVDTDKR